MKILTYLSLLLFAVSAQAMPVFEYIDDPSSITGIGHILNKDHKNKYPKKPHDREYDIPTYQYEIPTSAPVIDSPIPPSYIDVSSELEIPTATIPEPASLWLVLTGTILLVNKRKA